MIFGFFSPQNYLHGVNANASLDFSTCFYGAVCAFLNASKSFLNISFGFYLFVKNNCVPAYMNIFPYLLPEPKSSEFLSRHSKKEKKKKCFTLGNQSTKRVMNQIRLQPRRCSGYTSKDLNQLGVSFWLGGCCCFLRVKCLKIPATLQYLINLSQHNPTPTNHSIFSRHHFINAITCRAYMQ